MRIVMVLGTIWASLGFINIGILIMERSEVLGYAIMYNFKSFIIPGVIISILCKIGHTLIINGGINAKTKDIS